MSTMKDALAGAMNNNAKLTAAINTAIGKIKPCEIGKNVDGKFVPTGTFYMFGVRIFDTLDERRRTRRGSGESRSRAKSREQSGKQSSVCCKV